MKQIKIKLLLFSGAIFGLASCLKEGSPNVDTSNAGNVVQFSNTGNNSAAISSKYPNFYTDLGTLLEGASAEFNLNVSYAGSNNAPEDITVNLALDNDMLTLFNDQNGTSYVVPPSSVFSFPSSVVILKGTRTTQVKATVTRSADYDFAQAYALPLAISSASTGIISDNFGKSVYSFGVRNQYDGIYSVNGWVLRAGDPVLSGFFKDVKRNVVTTGASSNTFAQTWSTGSDAGGLAGLTLTVDPATNKVTVWCTSNPAVTNEPSYDNRYDPATKTYFVSFYWGTGPTNRAATDTLVYVSPRP